MTDILIRAGWVLKDNQEYIDRWNAKPDSEKFDPFIASSFPPSLVRWLEKGKVRIYIK